MEMVKDEVVATLKQKILSNINIEGNLVKLFKKEHCHAICAMQKVPVF